MLTPRLRLIGWTALTVVPALGLLGTGPAAGPAAAALLALGVAAAGIDALRSGRRLAGLAVRTAPVTRLVQAREGALELALQHPGARPPTLRLGLALPRDWTGPGPDFVLRLPDAPASRHAVPVTATRRGRFDLPAIHLEAVSPWGFWSVRRRDPLDAEIRVQPDLRPAARAGARFLLRGDDGQRIVRLAGRGREFDKLRDYLPGDPPEDLHWKATAKRGHPVTKVHQVERTQEVYVLVDASRLSGRVEPGGDGRPEPLLESFIRAALVVGGIAQRQGDRLGLVCFARGVETFLRAGPGSSHLAAARERLVTLQPRPVAPDFTELAAVLRTRLRQRALLLFLTCLDDPVVAEAFLGAMDLLRQQHLCAVVQARGVEVRPLFTGPPPAAVEDLYPALAGHLAWQSERELQRELGRRGVPLVSAPAPGLAAALLGRYLEARQQQRL